MTEQQAREIVEHRDTYDVYRYPSHWVVQVQLTADFDDAGNAAFRRLLRYISGGNEYSQSIAMTAPVVQSPVTDSVTSPARDHVVAFVLPESMSAGQPPMPSDGSVELRRIPEELAAVTRFSGRWTFASYQRHVERLLAALHADARTPIGPPRFARFDPPWTPWFLRRNEVVIPIAATSTTHTIAP